MENSKLAKKVFTDLIELSNQGFITWATGALKLVNDLGLDITSDKRIFATNCKDVIKNKFIMTWSTTLQNTQLYPILRTYRTIKSEFIMEPYLYLVKKPRYRRAIARFRCSSHTLQIERGRHTNPKTPVAERKCIHCDVIEDEKHFLLKCDVNISERQWFFQRFASVHDGFMYLDDEQKFSSVMKNDNDNPKCLSWLGQFLYQSFEKRNEYANTKEVQ